MYEVDNTPHPAQDLEEGMSRANATTARLSEQLYELQNSNKATEDGAGQMVKDLAARIRGEFTELKEELDHKFNLQTAENKRLQSHISSLKTENQVSATPIPPSPLSFSPPPAISAMISATTPADQTGARATNSRAGEEG